MRGTDLRHVIRATARVLHDAGVSDSIIVVIGSQAIHASYRDNALPDAMTMSAEADLLVVTADPGEIDRFATLVDGSIGEASPFHQTYGYYGQGIGPETATLPDGWIDRLVPIRDRSSGTIAFCLEPHDLCVAKLCANRPKDRDYVGAALAQRLVDGGLVRERLGTIDSPSARRAETTLTRIDTNPMTDDERHTWQRNRQRAFEDRRRDVNDVQQFSAELAARLCLDRMVGDGGTTSRGDSSEGA